MFFMGYTQERYNALIGVLMIVIAILFLLYMGNSMVHSTRDFWGNYSVGNVLE